MDQKYNNDEEYCKSSRGGGRGSQVHDVRQTPDDNYSGEDVLPMHTVNSGKTVAPYVCILQLNGVKIQMEIDTGATSTILNTQLFRKI